MERNITITLNINDEKIENGSHIELVLQRFLCDSLKPYCEDGVIDIMISNSYCDVVLTNKSQNNIEEFYDTLCKELVNKRNELESEVTSLQEKHDRLENKNTTFDEPSYEDIISRCDELTAKLCKYEGYNSEYKELYEWYNSEYKELYELCYDRYKHTLECYKSLCNICYEKVKEFYESIRKMNNRLEVLPVIIRQEQDKLKHEREDLHKICESLRQEYKDTTLVRLKQENNRLKILLAKQRVSVNYEWLYNDTLKNYESLREEYTNLLDEYNENIGCSLLTKSDLEALRRIISKFTK